MIYQCRVCKTSRKLGGKNLRFRSQALIDDDLLSEFNADTVWHYQTYGFDWEKICGILITHSRSDHLYIEDNGGQTYEEMKKGTENYDVIVSYDGLEVEF